MLRRAPSPPSLIPCAWGEAAIIVVAEKVLRVEPALEGFRRKTGLALRQVLSGPGQESRHAWSSAGRGLPRQGWPKGGGGGRVLRFPTVWRQGRRSAAPRCASPAPPSHGDDVLPPACALPLHAEAALQFSLRRSRPVRRRSRLPCSRGVVSWHRGRFGEAMFPSRHRRARTRKRASPRDGSPILETAACRRTRHPRIGAGLPDRASAARLPPWRARHRSGHVFPVGSPQKW